jgi:hypothetical protein
MAVDQTEAGVYDPPMPGEEGGVASSASVATLGQALGFINEFNHNVAIFEPLATVFVMAVLQLISTSGTVRRHTTDILQIRRDMELLRQAIGAAHVAAVARAEAEYRADYVASHNRGYTGRGR